MNVIYFLKNNLAKLNQVHLFYLVLLVNIGILFSVNLYPSLDGPAHLYNSKMIYHLLKGDSEIISNFFVFNSYPVPNWIDHFVITLFYFIFPSWLAEKGYLILYLICISVSFRLLVKQFNPNAAGLNILIFPFAYNYLFRLGFYNNTFSFVLLFYTLYYWLKNRDNSGMKKYFILLLLFMLTYFSNVLIFLFLGLALGLFVVLYSSADFYKKGNLKERYAKLVKELFWILLTAIPALFLFIQFTLDTDMTPFNSSHDFEYSLDELIRWINDAKALVVYVYPNESIISRQLVYIMIAVLAASIVGRGFHNKETRNGIRSKLYKSDGILLMALFSLILFFIIPDGQGAGMMSDRYCLLFFMFCILWVAVQSLPKKLNAILVLLVLIIHFDLLNYQMEQAIIPLNRDAELIRSSANHMEKNSTVLPINFTDNWLEVHFGDYIGVDKPMVVLENYEATIGWFPLHWNFDKMPLLMMGDKVPSGSLLWTNNQYALTKKQIDYVLIYGYAAKLKDQKWAELDTTLAVNYNLIYTSENYYVSLYKKK